MQLFHPARIRLRCDDADHVRHGMVELLPDHPQPGAVIRARDDAVAAQLAAQDLDLNSEEADAGVTARGARFKSDA